jgi:hypothetical protein
MCGKTKILFLWVALLLGGVFCGLLMPATSSATAGINQQMNFEGKVVKSDGTNLADGTYNMEFKIYQDGTNTGSGSTLKWTEDELISATHGVVVSGGTFQVNLGAITALSAVDFNQDTLWLSMQVGSGTSCTPAGNFVANCAGDGEMSPYIRLTAVPYAFNALKVGGIAAASLVVLSPGSQQSGFINASGNVTSGGTLQGNTIDAATAGTLTIGSTNSSAISIADNTTVLSGSGLTVQGGNALTLGSTTAAGGIVYQDGTVNNRTVTVSSPALTNSYTMAYPTSGATGLTCLQSTSGSTSTVTALQFGSCSSGGATISLNNLASVAINTDLSYAANAGSSRALTIATATSGNNGDALNISAGSGNGTTKNGGNVVISPGLATSGGTQGSVIVKPQSGGDSTLAFQVQSFGSATAVLSVDTVSGKLKVQGLSAGASIGSDLFGAGTCTGTNWTGTGPWTHTTGSVAALTCTPPASVTTGATYQVTVTTTGVTNNGVDSVKATIGGTAATKIYDNEAGIAFVLTTVSTGALTFIPSNTWSGAISALSIKLVTNANPIVSVLDNGGNAGLEVRSTGTSNSLVGVQSGQAVTTGSFDVSLGYTALQSNTTGATNTAVGAAALQSNTTASDNVAIGYTSLNANVTGNSNTATGSHSLSVNSTGSSNSAYGYTALGANVTGANNTAVGFDTLLSNITGSAVSGFGYKAGYADGDSFATSAGLQNATAIGANAQVQQNNSLILGSTGSSGSTQVGIGTTIPLNTFSVSPIDVSSGGSATTGGVVTALFSTFTSAMVGEQLIFTNGVSGIISSYTSATVVNITPSPSAAVSVQNFRVQKTGFQVTSSGNAYVQNTSTTAFQIQNAVGTSNLLVADTVNNHIGIGIAPTTYALEVHNAAISAFTDTGTGGYVTVNPNDGAIELGSGNDTVSQIDFKGSGNLGTDYQGRLLYADGPGGGFGFQTNASSNFALSINGNGSILAQNNTNSTSAFLIQNTSTAAIFTVDTTNSQVLINNPAAGFSNTTGTDNFNTGGASLPAQWTFYNGTVDASSTSYNSAVAGKLRISSSPTSTSRDCYNTTLTCLRVLETAPTADFTATAKLDSIPPLGASDWHAGGIIIESDATKTTGAAGGTDIIRFEVQSSSSALAIYVTSVIGGVGSSGIINFPLGAYAASTIYIKVARAGNVWTVYYSSNGSSFTNAGSFTQAITLTGANAKIGPTLETNSLQANYATADYDSFTVTQGSAVAAAALATNGDITQTNGTITTGGGITVQTGTNTATALLVQDSGNLAILTADTTNKKLLVGSATTDTNAVLLVLDSYSTATDPAGTNGAMYYNTAAGTFRCFENNSWRNCVSGLLGHDAFSVRAAGGTLNTTALNSVGILTTISGSAFTAPNQTDAAYEQIVTTTGVGITGGFISSTLNTTRRSYNPTCTALIRTPAALSAGERIYVGLTSAAVANANDPGGNFIGFRFSNVAGDTGTGLGWRADTRNGTTNTVGAANIAGSANVAVSTAYLLKFRVDTTSGNVYLSVNGSAEDVVSATVPAATTDLGAILQIQNTDANADTILINRFACEQS